MTPTPHANFVVAWQSLQLPKQKEGSSVKKTDPSSASLQAILQATLQVFSSQEETSPPFAWVAAMTAMQQQNWHEGLAFRRSTGNDVIIHFSPLFSSIFFETLSKHP